MNEQRITPQCNIKNQYSPEFSFVLMQSISKKLAKIRGNTHTNPCTITCKQFSNIKNPLEKVHTFVPSVNPFFFHFQQFKK